MQMGAISYETFFFNLEQGEMYAEGRTMEEEQAAIEKGTPQTPFPDPDPNDPEQIKARAAADLAKQKGKEAAKTPPKKPAAAA